MKSKRNKSKSRKSTRASRKKTRVSRSPRGPDADGWLYVERVPFHAVKNGKNVPLWRHWYKRRSGKKFFITRLGKMPGEPSFHGKFHKD
jgi:hypothetical protein